MTPFVFLTTIIDPALDWIEAAGGPKNTDPARRFLLAVSAQELGSTLLPRYQNSPSTSAGPARGRWQFEQGGAVHGVFTHAASAGLIKAACAHFEVAYNEPAIWRAIEGHDLLAAVLARALLWTDPYSIPTTQQPAWECYADRLWKPGKPHPETWPDNWAMAGLTVADGPIP